MPKSNKAKNPAAVALSARRMVKISPKRRKEIAQNAARARWKQRDAHLELKKGNNGS